MAKIVSTLKRRRKLTSTDLIVGEMYEMNGKEIVLAVTSAARYATAVIALHSGKIYNDSHFLHSDYRKVVGTINVNVYGD